MSWSQLYWLPSILGGAVAAVVVIFLWPRRSAPGAKCLLSSALALVVWSVANALQLASPDLPSKIFWSKAQYLGIVTLPPAFLAFALQYSGRRDWLAAPNLGLLSVVSLTTLVLAWTNEAHHLIWTRVWLDTSGPFPMEASTHGPWFWLWTVYAYLLILSGMILLVQTFIRSPHLYRMQVFIVLFGLVVPLIGNGLFLSGLSPFPHLDLTPFFFTVTGLALAWGLFRFKLTDIVPVARETVLEGMSDGVVVADAEKRIVYFNPAAQKIIDRLTSEAIGQPMAQVFADQPEFVEDYPDQTERHQEFVGTKAGDRRNYDLRISPLHDRRGGFIGRLFVLRDVTEAKLREKKLLDLNQELDQANQMLRRFLVIDWLTKIPNRRRFDQVMDEEWA
ncbi:MAG: PAS domain-containing protein, partial [Deltaproteobacteria bacterium]|nr:PAS domain-containing protein [Deltaproteobacteria bacterium]